MKRRMKAGESALLVVPVVGLAGFAWWQGRQTPKYPSSDDPTAPTILKAELEPVTPRDVYEGWDTRFTLVAKVPPNTGVDRNATDAFAQADLMNETLRYHRNGREVVMPTTSRKLFLRRLSNGESTTTILLMKLRDLPSSDSAVTLHAQAIAHYFGKVTTNGVTRNVDAESKPIPLSIVVRKPNQRVTLPVVSHHRPFALDSITVEAETSTDGTPQIIADTTVKVVLSASDTAKPHFTPLFHNVRLTDERGRTHQNFFSPNTKRPVSVMWSSTSTKDSPDERHHQWIRLPVGFLPKSAGRLTFRADVSVDDCWPLPISVVVRNRDGTIPTTK